MFKKTKKSQNHFNLRDMAEFIQSHGEDDDKILAHINPEEARFLSKNFGGDINPETGLPQFGGFKKFWKKAFPFVAGIAGNIVGGPVGGTLAGSLAGASQRGRGNKLEGALSGAVKGAAVSYASPKIGSALGVSPGSPMYNMMGMQHPGFAQSFGFGNSGINFGSNGGRASAMRGLQGLGSQYQDSNGMFGQMGDSLLGNGGMGSQLINAGLLGTAGYGMIKGHRDDKRRSQQLSLQDQIDRQNMLMPQSDNTPYRKPKPIKRRYMKPSKDYRPGFDPEHEYFEDANPDTEYYAHGGYVGGDSGGQDDDVYTYLPDGSYVMDATTTSLLGDGNSKAGSHKIRDMERTAIKKYPRVKKASGGKIKARISSGEDVISPEYVEAIGKGNRKEGVKKLDIMRKKLRKQKGVEKFLPPKTKKLSNYIRL